jgi:spore coat protein U-like protein
MKNNFKKLLVVASLAMMASVPSFAEQADITVTGSVGDGCLFNSPTYTLAFGDILGGTAPKRTAPISILCSTNFPYTLSTAVDYIQQAGGNSIFLYKDAAYTQRFGTNSITGTGTGNSVDIPLYAIATSGQGFVYKTGAMTGSITLTLTY